MSGFGLDAELEELDAQDEKPKAPVSGGFGLDAELAAADDKPAPRARSREGSGGPSREGSGDRASRGASRGASREASRQGSRDGSRAGSRDASRERRPLADLPPPARAPRGGLPSLSNKPPLGKPPLGDLKAPRPPPSRGASGDREPPREGDVPSRGASRGGSAESSRGGSREPSAEGRREEGARGRASQRAPAAGSREGSSERGRGGGPGGLPPLKGQAPRAPAGEGLVPRGEGSGRRGPAAALDEETGEIQPPRQAHKPREGEDPNLPPAQGEASSSSSKRGVEKEDSKREKEDKDGKRSEPVPTQGMPYTFNDATGMLVNPGGGQEGRDGAVRLRYVEEGGAFRRVYGPQDKTWAGRFNIQKPKFRRRTEEHQSLSGGILLKSLMDTCGNVATFGSIFAQSLLGGFAALHLFMTYMMDIGDLPEGEKNSGFLHYYSPIAIDSQRVYYALSALSLLAALNKYTNDRRANWQPLGPVQQRIDATLVLLYLAVVILTVVNAPFEDVLYYTYTRMPSYWKVVPLGSEFEGRLSLWHVLNFVRIVGAILAHLLVCYELRPRLTDLADRAEASAKWQASAFSARALGSLGPALQPATA